MVTKSLNQRCALVMIADGFNEIEAVVILSKLRQAGLCAKSVGLTSGMISGAHGILIMPDFTVTDLYQRLDIGLINLVVLPGEEYSLSKLEPDPRVHRLLRQVFDQGGFIATCGKGLDMLKAILAPHELGDEETRVLVWSSLGEPIEVFAGNLVRSMG